jgi:hypothetical protein
MPPDEPSVPSKSDEIDREPEGPERCPEDSAPGGRAACGTVHVPERLPVDWAADRTPATRARRVAGPCCCESSRSA